MTGEMTKYINIMVSCSKIGCPRGIGYCYSCKYFRGLDKTMEEVACDWIEETKKLKNKEEIKEQKRN